MLRIYLIKVGQVPAMCQTMDYGLEIQRTCNEILIFKDYIVCRVGQGVWGLEGNKKRRLSVVHAVILHPDPPLVSKGLSFQLLKILSVP